MLNISSRICPDGKVNYGDLYVTNNDECSIITLVIFIFWMIQIVTSFFILLYSSHQIYLRIHYATKRSKYWYFDSMFLLPVICSSYSMFIGIFAILKVINSKIYIVGANLSATIIFSCATSCYWILAVLFLWTYLRVAVMQCKIKSEEKQSSIKSLFHKLRIILPILTIGNIVWSMMPIFIYFKQENANLYITLHYVGLGLSILILGVLMVPWYITSLINDLAPSSNLGSSGSSSNKAITSLLKKMRFIRHQLISNGTINGIMSICVGVIPQLRPYIPYQLGFVYIVASYTALACTWTNSYTKLKRASMPSQTSSYSNGFKTKTNQSYLPKLTTTDDHDQNDNTSTAVKVSRIGLSPDGVNDYV